MSSKTHIIVCLASGHNKPYCFANFLGPNVRNYIRITNYHETCDST